MKQQWRCKKCEGINDSFYTYSFKNKGQYGYFSLGQRAPYIENHKKNVFIEIIDSLAAKINNLDHFWISLLLTSTNKRWNCSCNLQLLFTAAWPLSPDSCVSVMSLLVSWSFNVVRLHCMERLAAFYVYFHVE